MKKWISVCVVLVAACAISSPAFAQGWDWVEASYLDFKLSGEFRVEGVLNSNETLNDNDASSQYRKMRLRVQTDLNLHENLRLTSRFDAIEKEWHSKDTAFESQEDEENIDFDRAYMTIKSPVGLFMIGRQEGVTWGTSWADDEADTDRIKYILPVPDTGFILAAVAEKVNEFDRGSQVSDNDNDKWYVGAIYRGDNFDCGLLTALYNFKRFMDPEQRFAYEHIQNVGAYKALAAELQNTVNSLTTLAAFNPDVAPTLAGYQAQLDAANAKVTSESMKLLGFDGDAIATTCSAKVYLLSPYFRGKFGPFSIQSELDYVNGTLEYDYEGKEDKDVEGYSFFVEGKYANDLFEAQLGIANVRGDSDFTDGTVKSMAYVAPGADWGKMFILSNGNSDSGYNHGLNSTLGNGIGNHVGSGFATASTAMIDGYRMLYGGVGVNLMEDMFKLEFLAAYSLADDPPSKGDGLGKDIDDDQGMEFDVKLTWNMMDNLKYEAVAAYLAAGDYWKERGNIPDDEFEDTYALFHRLSVTF